MFIQQQSSKHVLGVRNVHKYDVEVVYQQALRDGYYIFVIKSINAFLFLFLFSLTTLQDSAASEGDWRDTPVRTTLHCTCVLLILMIINSHAI